MSSLKMFRKRCLRKQKKNGVNLGMNITIYGWTRGYLGLHLFLVCSQARNNLKLPFLFINSTAFSCQWHSRLQYWNNFFVSQQRFFSYFYFFIVHIYWSMKCLLKALSSFYSLDQQNVLLSLLSFVCSSCSCTQKTLQLDFTRWKIDCSRLPQTRPTNIQVRFCNVEHA